MFKVGDILRNGPEGDRDTQVVWIIGKTNRKPMNYWNVIVEHLEGNYVGSISECYNIDMCKKIGYNPRYPLTKKTIKKLKLI